MAERFTADQALDISLSRHASFEKTMAIIRNSIDNQIKDAAMVGKQSITVIIPRNIFGRDSFDPIEMGRALAEQLFADKFDVSGTYTRFIISWGRKRIDTLRPKPKQQQQPIIKVPTPRKK
ncbi:MAG: hypothetical protein P4L69_11365 [Desulfosporosinus sp.]|nr:hypothetical protein [Desulfosporosinus sp.]